MTTEAVALLPVSQWLAQLERPGEGLRRALGEVYGDLASHGGDRVALIRRTLRAFLECHGDLSVRVFRSPGRINLRGMHVDTHGGYLNLMTHQRETVVVASPRDDGHIVVLNLDPAFEPVTVDARAAEPRLVSGISWASFVQQDDVRTEIGGRRGHWVHYLKGCAMALRHRAPDRALLGMNLAVGSDVPHGAALSSSAALCVSVMLALAGFNGISLAPLELILAARDAEWYTGSRCGLSDQAAMVIGRRGQLANLAIRPSTPDVSGPRYVPFDTQEAAILVINSHTKRSLSGAEQARYTTNRFAYSLALEILRQEIRRNRKEHPDGLADRFDCLSAITPDAFGSADGPGALLRLIQSVPEQLSVEALRARYELPELDRAYEQYFGPLAEEHRPKAVGLRGPLLFGIAESERAREFAGLIEEKRWREAGALLTVGHQGDRVRQSDGEPCVNDVSDDAFERLVAANTPLAEIPGAYGASSPALDALVDAALAAGAWGASLTGAGIAGTVLALCARERVEAVCAGVRARLAAQDYQVLARLGAPLEPSQIEGAVVENVAVAGAGELAC